MLVLSNELPMPATTRRKEQEKFKKVELNY
jgi:hypothetical protein